jgi:hypothetical protein
MLTVAAAAAADGGVPAGKLSKGDKLAAVDHGTVQYAPFRRNFYIEVPDVKRMSEAEVAALRKEDGIKVRGSTIIINSSSSSRLFTPRPPF